MSNLVLHPMKEIRIIIEGEHLKFVRDLLDKVKATGYTVISNISGKGHHGFHEGHLMFNDTSSQVMIFTVVPEEKVEPILAGLSPLFNRHSGSMFVSDVAVSRRDRYIAEEK
jgi:nitrogen regulatory protein PII